MIHPLVSVTGCAAGLAVQQETRERDLLSNIKKQGINLIDSLKNRFEQSPDLQQYIGDIRGRGLFIGIELVKDSETKEPFDPKLKLHTVIKNKRWRIC